jgi:hypothetical protein
MLEGRVHYDSLSLLMLNIVDKSFCKQTFLYL